MKTFIAVIILIVAFIFLARALHNASEEQDRIGFYSRIVTTVDGTQYKVRNISSAQGYPLIYLTLADGTEKQMSPAQIKDISYVGEHTGK